MRELQYHELSVRSRTTEQRLGLGDSLNRETHNKSATGWSGSGVTFTESTNTGAGTGTMHSKGAKSMDTVESEGSAYSRSTESVPKAFGTPPNSLRFGAGKSGTRDANAVRHDPAPEPDLEPEPEPEVIQELEIHPQMHGELSPMSPTSPVSPTGSALRRKNSKTSTGKASIASSFPSIYAKQPTRPPPVPPMPSPTRFEMPRDLRELQDRLPPSAFARMQHWRDVSGMTGDNGQGSSQDRGEGPSRGYGAGSGSGYTDIVRVGTVSRQQASDGMVSPTSAVFSQIGTPFTGGTGDGDSQRSNFLRI